MDSQSTVYLIPSPLAQDTQHKAVPIYNQQVIASLKHFFAENIRTARRFLSSLQLGIKIDTLNFYELNKNTTRAELKPVLRQLAQNNLSVGMISEAGSPCIADPGNILVALAHEIGLRVEPLVGASSILLALIASGLNGQNFAFWGYLPIEEKSRVQKLQQLEKLSLQYNQAQIFMETPYRNEALLKSILQHCHPETWLCIATNITTIDEQIRTQKIKDWKKQSLPDLDKKPTIFILQAN
ncbi:MAG: SAM-dependent methyltransferase [Microscillaceae bacterium]|nr:SAM-dependent methyltransferase [Microscillaceae bacterium]MDW8461499.1 SAM-dependent methyltransferase [Cytophagales bacterium]